MSFDARFVLAKSFLCLLLTCVISILADPISGQRLQTPTEPTLVLAHYMPWYQAKPYREYWGWHWTMDKFDPDDQSNEQRPIASHFYPVIGPYDSSDEDVIECQLLQMKITGIDGVIVDWYGLQDFRDYATLHESTSQLVKVVERLGLKFVICYEDQTIPGLVGEGRIEPEDRVPHAVGELNWLGKNWFRSESYATYDGEPILLSFGQTGLSNDEWSQTLDAIDVKVAYFSQHFRRDAAKGAFDWPVPKEGLAAIERFEQRAESWEVSIPVVFPRFYDIYSEAEVHASYGRIADEDGQTLERSLSFALGSEQPIIQVATWNDWGEGTIVEPSREYGYRDLEIIRAALNQHRGRSETNDADLNLPAQLLELRRKANGDSDNRALDQIAALIMQSKFDEARDRLESRK